MLKQVLPKCAITDEEIMKCYPVVFQLRPHLSKALYLSRVKNMQLEGFNLVYIEDNREIVAVAGYRISTTLFMGKHLYVDDLITSEDYRSKGYGEGLIKWLRATACDAKCNYLHLDSGTHRHLAHKFYFKQNMIIASYHFTEKLSDS